MLSVDTTSPSFSNIFHLGLSVQMWNLQIRRRVHAGQLYPPPHKQQAELTGWQRAAPLSQSIPIILHEITFASLATSKPS